VPMDWCSECHEYAPNWRGLTDSMGSSLCDSCGLDGQRMVEDDDVVALDDDDTMDDAEW